MNAALVVKMLVEYTGREDLNNLNPTGALWYLNAAQRFLDRKFQTAKSVSQVIVPAGIGQMFISTPWCRSITGCWIANSSGESPLEKKSEEYLRELYPDNFTGLDLSLLPAVPTIALENLGTPTFYTPIVDNVAPHQNKLDAVSTPFRFGMQGVTLGDHYNIRTVAIYPPSEEALSIRVGGFFLSEDLEKEDDKSYWTMMHPHLLVEAACRVVEVANRNSEGVKDYERGIDAYGFELNKDDAREDAADNYMEG